MARAPGGLCTTRCQLFNDEITKTENSLRIKWFVKNRQLLLDNLRDEKLPLVRRAKDTRKKFEQQQQKNRRQDSVEEGKPLADWRVPNGSINLDVMRPIDPSVRSILYETRVERTGEKYLLERCKDKPENRYYYPDCTNWLYGWRLTDFYPPVAGTQVGRSSIIRETFYRRNASSLQRDPDSQRQCQTRNPKNFNEILIN